VRHPRLGKVIALRTEQDEQDQDQEQLKTFELCLLHVARLSRPLDESASDITRDRLHWLDDLECSNIAAASWHSSFLNMDRDRQ